MEKKRITLWLYKSQLEFIEKLREALSRPGSEYTVAECIRFCINLANTMLNFSPYTIDMERILTEALKRTVKEKREARIVEATSKR